VSGFFFFDLLEYSIYWISAILILMRLNGEELFFRKNTSFVDKLINLNFLRAVISYLIVKFHHSFQILAGSIGI
jgi:hypothetical protein